ncbi:polysaccharide pyruvyl transferase family protein [Rhizobium cremeum]|uniref:polysaccharide pyruvyl transferase family protein n=1 Tax=Rhizobium cremeum TaxID=2813827 RepID=UPI000DDB09A6|nr:polysaccharide pyruvyl transferase family protein [Rhizobium cremeum]MCJ7996439.1 polysaccharide pyruvyl transferase family protein [Rhizobium cremeum]MCJ8001698.1 polysaccharide pyruvyl transferase family protein [Rhizobium cremeum]
MKVFYYQDPQKNFGDDLNEWIWERLLPGVWDEDDSSLFAGIGTIIGPLMQPFADRKWTVFGSGVGYGPLPTGFGGKNWNIACVRGPLTAQLLRLAPETAVCDGAMLLRRLPEFAPLPEVERNGTIFMPHHSALHYGDWEAVCQRAGIEYVSPRSDSIETLERIRRAKLVIADAMHAAIVADAMRVPWVPVSVSPNTSTFKWLDWTMSLNLPYMPVNLPSSNPVEASRNFFSVAAGKHQSFAFHPGSDVVSIYSKAEERRNSESAARKFRWGLRVHKLAVSPWLRSAPRKMLLPRMEERYIDRAAAAMSAAAKGPTFLSEDRFLNAAVDNLSERLDKVRAQL